MKTVPNRNQHTQGFSHSAPAQRNRARRGFTLIEILVASSIMAVGMVIAIPALRGFVETGTTTANSAQARALVTAVNLYRMKTGVAIAGTAADPITISRANTIYAQIDGPINAAGETIVELGYQLPASATFPSGWGETAAGVFDPIP